MRNRARTARVLAITVAIASVTSTSTAEARVAHALYRCDAPARGVARWVSVIWTLSRAVRQDASIGPDGTEEGPTVTRSAAIALTPATLRSIEGEVESVRRMPPRAHVGPAGERCFLEALDDAGHLVFRVESLAANRGGDAAERLAYRLTRLPGMPPW